MNKLSSALRATVLVLVALAALALWGIGAWSMAGLRQAEQTSVETTIRLKGPDGEAEVLTVETADTQEEWVRGLMDRSRLDQGKGMLFLFDAEQPLSFWMKNTLLALDILFFDADGRFVSRAQMVPCETDPCPSTASKGPARYVLEVNAGEPLTDAVGSGWVLEL